MHSNMLSACLWTESFLFAYFFFLNVLWWIYVTLGLNFKTKQEDLKIINFKRPGF